MTEQRYFRRIIKIRGIDSPNVRIALADETAGRKVTGRTIVPGVLTWHEYLKRRATWDPIRQCIGLDAEFYEGAEVLMFPPLWLNRAELLHIALRGRIRIAKAIGIDPAEGGDKTAMAAVDELGLIELVSRKTPNTNDIFGEALTFIRKHNAKPENVCIDRGGGGKQLADRLRANGLQVRTVSFGESLQLDLKRGMRRLEEKIDMKEDHYAYKNRRAEMYGTLRELIDPARDPEGFAIPGEYYELRKELAPIPLTWDAEGRLELLPKHKPPNLAVESKKKTLVEIIGHSPDESDALVLAIYGMTHKVTRPVAGAVT